MTLPQYQCHKVVEALQIDYIETRATGEGGEYTLHFSNKEYKPRIVSREYIRKHNPEDGGYYVIYSDDYESYSPRKAFEEGYTKLWHYLNTW